MVMAAGYSTLMSAVSRSGEWQVVSGTKRDLFFVRENEYLCPMGFSYLSILCPFCFGEYGDLPIGKLTV